MCLGGTVRCFSPSGYCFRKNKCSRLSVLKWCLTGSFVRFTYMTRVPHHLCCECFLECCIYKEYGTSILVAQYGLREDACFILDTGRLSSDTAVREDAVEKSRIVFHIEGRHLILLDVLNTLAKRDPWALAHRVWVSKEKGAWGSELSISV